ncbi:MAG TPA: ABC transporter ATP-binding protein [Rhodopila sp.]|uniref:ABC transporter ATP-binding protein n=1 Tax=Rhodopila sp. TaxID=2480087 RepID=UPI002B512953|nr:ABC transporter ATP-binding protein [Rhodopila sp.]HVY16728.1 ABC transporter ATP-binding protein [Rhodopila sp.]
MGLNAELLDVRHLNVSFRSSAGLVPVVRDVSFRIGRGETVAIVGESGSGKSVTSLALLGLTPPAPACVVSGSVTLRDRDGSALELLQLSDAAMNRVRGVSISMVFQEPMSSLNPVLTVGAQIAESVRFHQGLDGRAAQARAAELLDLVGIPDAARRLGSYPHQLSGGMRQRVMIAIALACEPLLLIADEPTTALDVTIQAQILELLRSLQDRTGMAMIFITHNLGVVAEIAHRVLVMYNGCIVEQANVVPLFRTPLMPYTKGLLRSVPRLDLAGLRTAALEAIPGQVPDPASPPPGCGFAPRCPQCHPGLCDASEPALEEVEARHLVRCFRWAELP